MVVYTYYIIFIENVSFFLPQLCETAGHYNLHFLEMKVQVKDVRLLEVKL